jgi:nucleotide-binding universal stress UspA family protein
LADGRDARGADLACSPSIDAKEVAVSRKNPVIVVATDFSPGSEAALRAAQSLWPEGAPLRVHVAHVLAPFTFAGPPLAAVATLEEARTATAQEALTRTVVRLRKRLGSRARVTRHLLAGSEQSEICRLADRVHADLIVVGTHGRTGLEHMLVGSIAERIVRHAGRPVLTVPLLEKRRRRR